MFSLTKNGVSRLRSIHDLVGAGLDAIAACKGCGHRAPIDMEAILRRIPGRWRRGLDYEGRKLRCSKCGHKGARIAPIPRIVGPLDCAEFQADIDRMWERVMAEQLAGQCNAEIAAPDSDGLVYVTSNSDKAMIMACLGTNFGINVAVVGGL